MGKEINIENLLHQVVIINKKHDEIAKITGSNFNIFSILRMEYDEVRLHSRFLGSLLDPKGKHEMGSLFLKQFINLLQLSEIEIDELDKAKVYVEEYNGTIDKAEITGGNIDIVIKPSKGRPIVIENKINAGDQDKQLIRYRRAYPDAYLLYLTKFGSTPSEISTHINNQQIVSFNNTDNILISYEIHIIEWLVSCRKETLEYPLLRETLSQYINVVKNLTNKVKTKEMEKDIIQSILNNVNNLNAFYSLRSAEINSGVEHALIDKFREQLNIMTTGLGLEYHKENDEVQFGISGESTEIAYKIPNTSFFIYIGFEYWKTEFYICLYHDGPINNVMKEALNKKLSDQIGPASKQNKNEEYYLHHFKDSKKGDEYLSVWDAGKIEVWGSIMDGTIIKKIKEYFKIILDAVNMSNK